VPFWPNAITVGRLTASSALSVIAIRRKRGWQALGLGGAALVVQWIGDSCDGVVARRLDQETVIGAWNDSVADRIAVCLGCAAIWLLENEPLAAAFGLHYLVSDGIVTMSFTRFNLGSPNYFYLVDEGIYKMNWSLPAKVCSQLPLVMLALRVPRPIVKIVLTGVVVWKLTTLAAVARVARRQKQAGYHIQEQEEE
jgi:CDP-diacylglycerol--glycerol-3-phosphate 3-phosphatidyltransferase